MEKNVMIITGENFIIYICIWYVIAYTLPLVQNTSIKNKFHSVSTLGPDSQILFPLSPTQLHLRSE